MFAHRLILAVAASLCISSCRDSTGVDARFDVSVSVGRMPESRPLSVEGRISSIVVENSGLQLGHGSGRGESLLRGEEITLVLEFELGGQNGLGPPIPYTVIVNGVPAGLYMLIIVEKYFGEHTIFDDTVRVF